MLYHKEADVQSALTLLLESATSTDPSAQVSSTGACPLDCGSHAALLVSLSGLSSLVIRASHEPETFAEKENGGVLLALL